MGSWRHCCEIMASIYGEGYRNKYYALYMPIYSFFSCANRKAPVSNDTLTAKNTLSNQILASKDYSLGRWRDSSLEKQFSPGPGQQRSKTSSKYILGPENKQLFK